VVVVIIVASVAPDALGDAVEVPDALIIPTGVRVVVVVVDCLLISFVVLF